MQIAKNAADSKKTTDAMRKSGKERIKKSTKKAKSNKVPNPPGTKGESRGKRGESKEKFHKKRAAWHTQRANSAKVSSATQRKINKANQKAKREIRKSRKKGAKMMKKVK